MGQLSFECWGVADDLTEEKTDPCSVGIFLAVEDVVELGWLVEQ